MLSSICFMPASLAPQSLPPLVPIMSSYFFDSTVVTCMRAGLYQQKNGLPVFAGALRSSQSMTCEEISSSTVFERSRVSGPSSWPIWFLAVPSGDFIQMTGRGAAMQTPSFGSISPAGSGMPGIGTIFMRGTTACVFGLLLISGKLTCCIASR